MAEEVRVESHRRTYRSSWFSSGSDPVRHISVVHPRDAVPVSRGGLSVVENLQTLCRRCDRVKGTKLLASPPSVPIDYRGIDGSALDYVHPHDHARANQG